MPDLEGAACRHNILYLFPGKLYGPGRLATINPYLFNYEHWRQKAIPKKYF